MKQRQDGYTFAYRPGHPDAHADGYILLHRLVRAEHLGRRLSPEEVVHHKDGDPRNNDISNLELLDSWRSHQLLHWETLTPEERQAKTAETWPKGSRHSAEARAKMSEAKRGNQYRKGIPHTPEAKARISAKLTGRKRGPPSEETKRKIAEALKGKPGYMLGRKHSEETKRKISEAARLRSARRRESRAAAREGDASPPASEAGAGR